MRAYLSILRVRFLNGLQYRAAALSGLTTQFFWGIMAIFIYYAFYKNGLYPENFNFSQLVTYIWLQQAFLALIMIYDWDYELFDMIISGNISYELVRPCNLYGLWFSKLLSRRLAAAAMRFLPILVIAFILPKSYRLSLPDNPASFLLFLFSMSLGTILLVSISVLIYISIFKTMSPIGSMTFIGIAGEFFSGMIVPIPLMPGWLRNLCYLLPFRWISDLPFRIYSGNIGANEAVISILIQLFWIFFLAGSGFLVMKRITNRIIIQGG